MTNISVLPALLGMSVEWNDDHYHTGTLVAVGQSEYGNFYLLILSDGKLHQRGYNEVRFR